MTFYVIILYVHTVRHKGDVRFCFHRRIVKTIFQHDSSDYYC